MFHVHIVDYAGRPGEKLRSFRSYPAAEEFASRNGTLYENGTVVIDDVRRIVDWGARWSPLGHPEIEIEEPFYARRLRLRRSPLAAMEGE